MAGIVKCLGHDSEVHPVAPLNERPLQARRDREKVINDDLERHLGRKPDPPYKEVYPPDEELVMRSKYPAPSAHGDFNTFPAATRRQREYVRGRKVEQRGIDRGKGAVVKSGHTHAK